ncbi:hypothetical protein [Hyphomicrobium sp.]|uniref:hypothetical protein n=1 Tax=Hyphomicrobium sp. TaxID=82 RepID=UPI002CAEBA09|nr:hypothetical protein [Hyphomicrobium sp.]HVZ03563.1 hypothetical protein [Hyphomicrobium sp.]
MQDLMWQLKNTDSFTFYTAAVFTALVFWFIREIVDAPTLAVGAVPVLMAGGLLAPIFFRAEMITLAYDHDTNLAAVVGVGVLAGLALVIGMKWLGTLFVEYRVRRTRLAPMAGRQRVRR